MRILWFQALWKPHFENKRNFWIKCVCIKAFMSWYTHKKTFAFIAYLRVHLHHGIPTMGQLHHDIPTRGHLHPCMPIKRRLHHDTSTRSICIMTYPLEGICSARHLHLHLYKRTFASWYIYKKHLHHDMPIRRHLHNKTFYISISVRRHLHHG